MTILVVVNGALRRHQNALLAALAGQRVFYVWHDDPTLWQVPDLPLSAARWRFLADGVCALRASLAAEGHALTLTQGPWAETLSALAQTLDAEEVRVVDLPASREQAAQRALEQRLQAAGRRLRRCGTHSLLTERTLGCELAQLPDVFTRCRRLWEQRPLDWPRWPDRPDLGLAAPWPADWPGRSELTPWPDDLPAPQASVGRQPFVGSEAAGLARLRQFLWTDRAVLTYKQTRNGFDGEHFASLLSPWLATGALSVQRVWDEVVAFEQAVTANESTYWLRFELLWREFFHWQCRRQGARWFSRRPAARDAVADFTPVRLDAAQQRRWQQWLAGSTGQALVDANLALLQATGWMSNRGRQLVASHFVHDLGLDWRLGARAFEAALVDYDPGSNWGNWAYVAGVGHDPRGGRAFNLKRQAETWDPEGAFVARWGQRTR